MKKFKWDKVQIRALKGSIKKWEKIVDGTGVDRGIYNCPCCDKFHYCSCINCPIHEFTGYKNCVSTPYDEWNYVKGRDDCGDGIVKGVKSLMAANEELSFLKKLLKLGTEKKEKKKCM